MSDEIHLFIIWSKGLSSKDKILSDITSKFEIVQSIQTEWSRDKFSENLSRFYGENLPKNSSKEKHCGTGSFLCIIVRDKNPSYELRLTSKGTKSVNINMFDAKQLYRNWTGGGHKIHATDNITETRHNLYFLYKLKYNDLLDGIYSKIEEYYEQDLIGARGWKSLDEIFDALNELINYVVLRNFENLDAELDNLHPDIDLLTDNNRLLADIINGKKTLSKEYRAQFVTTVDQKKVFFDLRFVGDDYYDYKWEQDILKTRIKYKGMYVPNDEHHFYSLMYHAFVHKPYLSKDYVLRLMHMALKVKSTYTNYSFVDFSVLDDLNDFIIAKNYNYVEPVDLSVFYNTSVIRKFRSTQLSKDRLLFEKKRALILKLKNVIRKVLYKFLPTHD